MSHLDVSVLVPSNYINIIYNKSILPDVSVLDAYMLDVASLDVAARCFLFRWIDPGSILGRSSTETS